MFWACLPVTTAVSCVPDMLGYGSRGVLVSANAQEMALAVEDSLKNSSKYREMCLSARDWSQMFTLEKFEQEIKSLLRR